MKRYVAEVLSVNDQTAAEVSKAVWQSTGGGGLRWGPDGYGSRILLPLAHAVINDWKGYDSVARFSGAARHYGIPSLEQISWLQVHGLDERYCDVIGQVYGKTYAAAQEVVERIGWSIWMACTAGFDVLHESLPRGRSVSASEFQLIHPVVSNAKFLTANISSERFRELPARPRIEAEAKTIVSEFGWLLEV